MKQKRKRMTMRQRDILAGYLFKLPLIIGIAFFFLPNLFRMVQYSFSTLELNQVDGGYTLISQGFANFIEAFTQHATFNRELVESLIDILVNVPLIIFFSLFMAVAINRPFKGRSAVRAIFFLPVIMATGAIVSSMDAVQRLMMGGISSMPPEAAGATSEIDATYAALMLADFGMPMVIIEFIIEALGRLYEVIRASGVQIVIFLAALQSIPGSMYEVAKIEGATAYETFWLITFPMISPIILTNVVYTIIDMFAQSEVLATAFSTAFTNFNFGLSSAMSLISVGAACLILLVSGYFISRKVFYQGVD